MKGRDASHIFSYKELPTEERLMGLLKSLVSEWLLAMLGSLPCLGIQAPMGDSSECQD